MDGRSLVENAIDVSLNAIQYRRNFEIFFGDDYGSASNSPEAEGPSGNSHRHMHEYSDSMSIMASAPFGGGNHRLTLNEQHHNIPTTQRQHVLLMVKPHIEKSNALHTLLRILNEAGFDTVSRNKETVYPYHQFMNAFQNEVDPSIVDAVCDEWSSGSVNVLELKRI